ncbi:hypothetical protein SNE40_012744 [Patella caerulea]
MLLAGGTTATIMASIPALKLHAAETSSETKQIKITELPIYSSPVNEVKFEYVEEEIGSFRSAISEVRKSVWSYLDSVKDTTDSLKQKYETGKAHTTELITYIQDDPAILPRAGVITVAGLGGIVAGYKGGILRKVVLSSSAMAAAAALCYPKEAVALTNDIYNITYDAVKPLWEDSSAAVEEKVKQTKEVLNEKKNEVKEKIASKPVDKSLMDMGQSKEEDKDMYTTRGS